MKQLTFWPESTPSGKQERRGYDLQHMKRIGLAWDVVACRQKPPLLPTTCAILRTLSLLGTTTYSELKDFIPCSPEAVHQQLVRLCRAGLAERRKPMATTPTPRGGPVYRYALSSSGRLMMQVWESEHRRALEQLIRLIAQRERRRHHAHR